MDMKWGCNDFAGIFIDFRESKDVRIVEEFVNS